MLDYSLSREQLDELRAAHRRTRDQREADRIKAVVALATGWTAEEVAELLQIDPNTVRNHFKRYRTEGLAGLNRVGEGVGGSPSLLTEEQLILGYVYKKPRYVPGKADREAQEQFLAEYEKLQETKGKDDPIYFMDAVHPQHNPVRACGWIKRGEDQEVRTNAGRERININGAIDLDRLEPVVRFDPTIDSDSTLALFAQLEAVNPNATAIYIICDNAPYYRSRAVQDYLKTSCIQLVFLPSYAPNLNLIERFWKFFKKKTLYNQYFETFAEFKAACEEFFRNPSKYQRELRSLLTNNFELIG